MKSEMGLTSNFSNPTIWSLEKKMLQIIMLEVTTPLERNILMQQWIKCEKLQKIVLVCKVFLFSILSVEELDQVILHLFTIDKLVFDHEKPSGIRNWFLVSLSFVLFVCNLSFPILYGLNFVQNKPAQKFDAEQINSA